jgi:hypothetical protein
LEATATPVTRKARETPKLPTFRMLTPDAGMIAVMSAVQSSAGPRSAMSENGNPTGNLCPGAAQRTGKKEDTTEKRKWSHGESNQKFEIARHPASP